MKEESTNDNSITNVILALDIGSSSIRCTPYEYSMSKMSTSGSTVRTITGCSSAVRKVSSVRPNSGHIILSHSSSSSPSTSSLPSCPSSSLFDEIDHCIDESLNALRLHFKSNESNAKNITFRIVGVGISSFVMNLIGINSKGQLINEEEATLSYACNSPEVVHECQRIRNEIGIGIGEQGDDGDGRGHGLFHDLYQRTGAPLHNAYALPQLRVYYKNNKNNNNNNSNASKCNENEKNKSEEGQKDVYKWTTISSYCLLRWTGQIFENNNNNINNDDEKNSSNNNLFKEIPISFSEASWTGLFNFRTCTWDQKCLDLLPDQCRKSLPRVADYTCENEQYVIEEYCSGSRTVTGIGTTRVRNPYWERWPELRGSYNSSDNADDSNNNCKLFLGFGDGICANIGSKCSSPDRIACTIGTSAAARICLPYGIVPKGGNCDGGYDCDNFVVPFGLFCYRIDKHHVLLGGALTDGGSVVEHLRTLLNLNTDDAFLSCLEEAALSYQRDSEIKENINNGSSSPSSSSNNQNNELSVVPFLSGERSTGYRGGATGCILGLTRNTKSHDLLRSSLEGVILRLNDILKLIEGASKSENQKKSQNKLEGVNIIASGNALERNMLWRQMLSDCTGKRVVKDGDAHEGTSRGVAILISHAIDDNRHLGKMNREELVVEEEQVPNLRLKSYWPKQKERQDNAIQCLSPMWK